MQGDNLWRDSVKNIKATFKAEMRRTRAEVRQLNTARSGYRQNMGEDVDEEEEDEKVKESLKVPFKDPRDALKVLNDPDKLMLFESWCRKQAE